MIHVALLGVLGATRGGKMLVVCDLSRACGMQETSVCEGVGLGHA